jgi:hypothetical protein
VDFVNFVNFWERRESRRRVSFRLLRRQGSLRRFGWQDEATAAVLRERRVSKA